MLPYNAVEKYTDSTFADCPVKFYRRRILIHLPPPLALFVYFHNNVSTTLKPLVPVDITLEPHISISVKREPVDEATGINSMQR